MNNCRTGVYICSCGTNIAKIVDVDAVVSFAAGLPDVVLARTYKYMCSNPGQEMITQDIRENHLDRVVVAACSPNMHERTFRTALKSACLNQYLLEMANIREQCSWVHTDPIEATEKAKALVHAAICRVRLHESLDSISVRMCPNVLVIGGGIAGMTAALELAEPPPSDHALMAWKKPSLSVRDREHPFHHRRRPTRIDLPPGRRHHGRTGVQSASPEVAAWGPTADSGRKDTWSGLPSVP